MARRRNSASQQNLDIELSGVAAVGFAIFLALAMFTPPERGGAIGYFVRTPLTALFGTGWAIGVPLVIGITGALSFFEIIDPGQILTLGLALIATFVLAIVGFEKGFLGRAVRHGLDAVFGDLTGGVLWLIFFMLAVAVFQISIKRLIGRAVYALLAIRLPKPQPLRFSLPKRQSVGSGVDLKKKPEAAKSPPVVRKVEAAPIIIHTPTPTTTPKAAEPGVPEPEAYAPPRPSPIRAIGMRPEARRSPQDQERISAIHEEMLWTETGVVEGHYSGQDGSWKPKTYRLPPMDLFDEPVVQAVDDESRAELLKETLGHFGVNVTIENQERGPSITRYEVKPDKGVKISRITALADDLALALAATSVRIEAPIPGKSAVGIEVPNAVVSVVAIREILELLPAFGSSLILPMALGKDITGRPVFGDLARMPHLLVAGATGAGKSVCLNNIIASILAYATPDQVQMLMIDPKRVELTVYNGIPHLVKDVITDARLAAGALFEMTKEMDSRYERFAKAGVRKVEEYNAKFPDEKLPYVVVIIDELADLMLVAPAKVETTICRLAQLARATGIHLIVATQRPSVDVITGIIKANIPSRIAFAVSSQVDSRTILDMGGAERLLGRGDMLFLPIDAPKPKRAQGALITGEEVTRLVEFWAAQARPKNLLEVDVVPIEEDGEEGKGLDPLSYDAAKFIIETNYASTAQLQSNFQIGHPRAVRLMKGLEEMKVVGPHEGTKPRKILIGIADLELMASRFGKKDDEIANSRIVDETQLEEIR